MAEIKRARPNTLFGRTLWEELSARSAWRGLALVVHAWAVIAAAMALVALMPNPLTWALAVMVVGCRQLGLAILMHEGSHGLLNRKRSVNDGVAQWLCAAPIGADLPSYRDYHLKHHRYTQQAEDPDLELSKPFPVSRASLRRKIIRDLTGQTFFKQRVALIALVLKGGAGGVEKEFVRGSTAGLQRMAITNILLLGLTIALGVWPVFFTVWLVAMATWFPLATRIRNIAEHACTTTDSDPFSHARTTRINWVERILIAPYWVNYHAEHHLFMGVPCYRLPAVHKMLMDKGYGERMQIEPGGYRAVLRTVTSG